MSIWHTLNLNLYARFERLYCTLIRIDVPTCLTEHQVNVHLASLCLRDVASNLHNRFSCLYCLLVCCLYHPVRRHHLHIGRHHYWVLYNLRHKITIKRFYLIDYTQFQEYSTHHIVDVQEREERLSLGYIGSVSTIITHLTHIVYRHHHPVITNEVTEWVTLYQLKERCALTNLNALHLVQCSHNVLQRSTGIDGTNIRITRLILLCCRAESIQRI